MNFISICTFYGYSDFFDTILLADQIHSNVQSQLPNWNALKEAQAACAARVHMRACSLVMQSCRRSVSLHISKFFAIVLTKFSLILQISPAPVPLASRPCINRCSAVGTAFKCVAVRAASATTPAVRVKSAICGSTRCANPYRPTLSTRATQTTRLRCGFMKQRICHQRRSISANYTSTKRYMDALA